MTAENGITLPNQNTEGPQPSEAVETAHRVEVASQWKLMWWKFRKHKLAMVAGVVVICIYLIAMFADFLAPYPSDKYSARYTYAPPQRLHFFLRTEDGLKFQPHVHGYISKVDPVALRRSFTIDESNIIPVGFFVKGEPYKLWNIFELDRRLIGPTDGRSPMYLFGADRMGRDIFSRVIYGTRVSMTIGLVGVTISLVLGVLLGGISGYFGGTVDIIIQRVIEFLRSMPQIPLWMAMAAAIPLTVPPTTVYFLITIILAFLNWTGLAREVRGKFLSLKTEDFVIAARLDGASEMRIITRHMVPSYISHIIASVTLAIPGTILAETSLSFLGVGLRPPVVSWGVLLQEAQNIRAVSTAPWLLLPGAAVIIAVLSLNFLGDGLRDAADPYSR